MSYIIKPNCSCSYFIYFFIWKSKFNRFFKSSLTCHSIRINFNMPCYYNVFIFFYLFINTFIHLITPKFYFTKKYVSLAIINSSSVGITHTSILESSPLILISSPRVLLFSSFNVTPRTFNPSIISFLV